MSELKDLKEGAVTLNPWVKLTDLLKPACPESATRLRAAMASLDPVSESLRAKLDRPTPSVRITASRGE